MKKSTITRRVALLLAILALITALSACTEPAPDTEQPASSSSAVSDGEGSTEATLPPIWSTATHKEAKTFGNGEKTFTLAVIAEGHSVTFTIYTNEEFLGAALLAHDLIAGEEGAYGLYVKTVNGILADYDVDQTYWSIEQNGSPLMTGVDMTPIQNGAHYELVRKK